MGRVRSTYIKRAARELLGRYPDKFSPNYEQNRRLLDELTTIDSKSLKNKIAGYMASLLKQKSAQEGP
jgi:small subunit ribosomal protein S17e